jgi:hypothetical protein
VEPAPAASISTRRTGLGQVVNLGYDLRERLEQIAQAEGRDATGLARSVLREYVEQQGETAAARAAAILGRVRVFLTDGLDLFEKEEAAIRGQDPADS